MSNVDPWKISAQRMHEAREADTDARLAWPASRLAALLRRMPVEDHETALCVICDFKVWEHGHAPDCELAAFWRDQRATPEPMYKVELTARRMSPPYIEPDDSCYAV